VQRKYISADESSIINTTDEAKEMDYLHKEIEGMMLQH